MPHSTDNHSNGSHVKFPKDTISFKFREFFMLPEDSRIYDLWISFDIEIERDGQTIRKYRPEACLIEEFKRFSEFLLKYDQAVLNMGEWNPGLTINASLHKPESVKSSTLAFLNIEVENPAIGLFIVNDQSDNKDLKDLADEIKEKSHEHFGSHFSKESFPSLENQTKPFLDGDFISPLPLRGRIILEFPPMGAVVEALSFFNSIENLLLEIKKQLRNTGNEGLLKEYEKFLESMEETWTDARNRFNSR
jgi:hypothetical protein